jgi:DNA-binding NtrC family response regulator|tara:strand:- start:2380 stop:3750 length:1371 start_codon:yes stop_codon:yes gene_type:complete
MQETTKIVLIEQDSISLREALTVFARGCPISVNTWCSTADIVTSKDTAPMVVISIFPTEKHKTYVAKSRIRQNHIEFVDVFIENAKKGFDHTAGQLHAQAGAHLIEEALSIAEQKILQRVTLLTPEVDEDLYYRFNLVGRSANFIKAMRAIKRVAKTDSRVIIRGESGTGKEVTARAIHHFSKRSDCAFVPVNCGAFNDDMLLSELFGYKKGAFTGAFEDRLGLLEHAHDGTLFLDEVDALSQRAQVSLLRFLQEGEVRPVGGRSTKTINVRVIAASNKNLKTLVKSGTFREDLLYRLDVLSVQLPALRQREGDLALICQHILSRVAQELNQEAKLLSLDVLNAIQDNQWRGNFREIESALLRAVLSSDGRLIDDPSTLFSDADFEDLPRKLPLSSFRHEKDSLIRQFESEYIRKALTQTGGNVTKAAEIAKKERRAFTRLMAKHGIMRESFSQVG